MSRLFGNRDEKAARQAAAEAEVNRLVALPVVDLSAELMAAFGADGPGRGGRHEVNLVQLSNWRGSTSPAERRESRPSAPLDMVDRLPATTSW